jgi:hypothetical protein
MGCMHVQKWKVNNLLGHLVESKPSPHSLYMPSSAAARTLLQVSSALHVYGHSHINADITLPAAAAAAAVLPNAARSSNPNSSGSSNSSRRYVQYALDAVGPESAGLYCLWDGKGLAAPGTVLPITGL